MFNHTTLRRTRRRWNMGERQRRRDKKKKNYINIHPVRGSRRRVFQLFKNIKTKPEGRIEIKEKKFSNRYTRHRNFNSPAAVGTVAIGEGNCAGSMLLILFSYPILARNWIIWKKKNKIQITKNSAGYFIVVLIIHHFIIIYIYFTSINLIVPYSVRYSLQHKRVSLVYRLKYVVDIVMTDRRCVFDNFGAHNFAARIISQTVLSLHAHWIGSEMSVQIGKEPIRREYFD